MARLDLVSHLLSTARDMLSDTIASLRASGQDSPLVPQRSIAGRTLATIVAIMTFLATVATGGVSMVLDTASEWRQSIAREMTVQIRPSPGRDIEADLSRLAEAARRFPGIAQARIMTRAQAQGLLEPWLGTGIDLGDLPLPRLLEITLDTSKRVDPAQLRDHLNAVAPQVSVDDHRYWLERLGNVTRTMLSAGIGIVILVVVATGLSVAFATRSAVAVNRDIIDVLNLVGAENRFIVNEFGHHFLKRGLIGGLIGGLLGLAAIWVFGLWRGQPNPQQGEFDLLFGSFALGWSGMVAVLSIIGLLAVATALVSRWTVWHHLNLQSRH
jgi:cell division transport system permease protein